MAVADELHFGRAAQRLHIAQPALSQQIRKLELEIEAELFLRNRREVRITPAGLALVPYARRALSETAHGCASARRAAAGEIGHLNVGFIETAAGEIVPRAVRAFRADRPDVGLTLRELAVDTQLDELRVGRIDVAIVRPPIDSAGIAYEQIAEEGLVAAIPTAHRLADRTRLSARTVADEDLVVLAREVVPGLYDEILVLRQEARGTGGIAQEATSVQAVLGLVAAGLGVAVLPASARTLQREGVRFAGIRSRRRTTLIAARRIDDTSPLVHAFIGAAQDGAAR